MPAHTGYGNRKDDETYYPEPKIDLNANYGVVGLFPEFVKFIKPSKIAFAVCFVE